MTYPRELVAHLAALCEADPGREVCGFVIRRGGALHIVQIANVADRSHAENPVRFPRTSREAYLMDPEEQLRLHQELREAGGEIAAIWHSHVEAGPDLSGKDLADAVLDGRPVVPGAEQLVLAVRHGRPTEVKRFRWDGRAFVEAPLEDPER